MSLPAYEEVLATMERAFHALAEKIPPPVLVDIGGHLEFRYEPKSLEAALIQKLARTISGLHAILALLRTGLYQEVGVLFRVLDELNEDISFLAAPLRGELQAQL